MIDLQKMTEKAAQAVRKICTEKGEPLLALSFLFYEAETGGFEFKTYLAVPETNIPQEEVEKINKAFAFINQQVAIIFSTPNLDDVVPPENNQLN